MAKAARLAALLFVASCSSGGAPRTVAAAFETTHWLDDGSKTTVREAPSDHGLLKAILIPDGSAAGYTTKAVSVDANQAFSVESVPAGSYFVQLDAPIFPCCVGGLMVEAVARALIEQSADRPDFGRVTAARADVAKYDFSAHGVAGKLQPVNLSQLDPWTSGDEIRGASAQALSGTRVFLSPAPPDGATVFAGAQWSVFGPDGLPDAAKGDSVYIFQRSIRTVGSGETTASVLNPTRYVRRTDVTAVPDGGAATDVALGPVPQTGSIHLDVRYSQFAALRAQVHPDAVLSTVRPFMSVVAVPRSVTHPEMPRFEETTFFSLANLVAIDRDLDYGTLAYGEFFDSNWRSYRSAVYFFDVNAPVPSGFTSPDPSLAVLRSQVPLSDANAPIVPLVGPPAAPRIEGRDGFTAQRGVGLQPTISWSPPTLGTATSYQLTITRTGSLAAGEVQQLTVTLFSATRFRIPPGILKAGALYSTVITARSAPWDAGDHAPFRTGIPLHTADCVLGMFTP